MPPKKAHRSDAKTKSPSSTKPTVGISNIAHNMPIAGFPSLEKLALSLGKSLRTTIKADDASVRAAIKRLHDLPKYTVNFQALIAEEENTHSRDTGNPETPSRILNPITTTISEIISHLSVYPGDIYKLTPRKFEELIAELFSGMGYSVRLTSVSRDGGRDVLASRNDPTGKILTLIECKRFSHTHKVDVGLVRSLYGVVEADCATRGILATTSFFTRDAKKLAKSPNLKYRISLADYDSVIEWINRHKK
ncbi:restriction endonuclease [Corallococcus sp. Z5C101001]|uniref:restriction endonuclease n=1 Tax=Corallococcus sp. Z5C101001 TaxID=2596829 RepID=UPI00117CD39E|nr:restriction endonuclease [Corallococcus sp. Z5C101001]TSC19837.1 hypothetical protein FOF48_35875 [Corallococcus sp. Z5C101001]